MSYNKDIAYVDFSMEKYKVQKKKYVLSIYQKPCEAQKF